MKYKIIDNALSQEEFKKIKDLVLGFYFPWFFAPWVAQKTSKDGFHFNHVFFGVEPHKINSDFFNIENPPARACVEVSSLPKGVLVEIDCVAFLD